MVLFHRTARAQEILNAGGFRDGVDDDRPGLPSGAWLSSALAGCGDGAEDDGVLVLKLPIAAIRQYEQLQVGQTYRTFLVPPNVINQHIEGRMIARTAWMRVRVPGMPVRPPEPYSTPVLTETLIREVTERVGDEVRAYLRAEGREPEWPRWMTTSTVARYIDRSESDIRGLMARGAIPFVKQGGLMYFDRFVIDKWMASWGRPQTRAADMSWKHPKHSKGGA
jgi:hypothetical protein